MTEQQIIDDWFSQRENRDQIATISYTRPIYDFIRATASMRNYAGGEPIYNVFGDWQKIRTYETEDHTT